MARARKDLPVAECFFFVFLRRKRSSVLFSCLTKGMCLMKKGGVGNADFPWLPLAQVPSRAAAAQARGVLGENYSLISHFTET